MKILFVVNRASFFLSHRLPLALEAQARGYDCAVVSAGATGEQELEPYGLRHIPIPMSRSGFDPLEEYRSYREIKRVYREEQPDLVHHVTIKPVIYGGIAAQAVNVPAVVNAVPGMGFVFTRRGIWPALQRTMVNMLYRMALEHPNMRVIFQNSEDMRGFLGHAIVRKDDAVLIRGSGVDLTLFTETEEPPEPVVFLLVARMLRDKGVREFVQAAARVRATHGDWRFVLVGDVDEGNPATLTVQELQEYGAKYGIEWLGHQWDVPALLRDCHVVCLPTYREGLPKTLLEASAAGRAMIATDIAGCREVITEGVNGLLVPTRDADALAGAMMRLGTDAAMRARMGHAARQRAEAAFDVDDVVDHTFRVYDELLAG